MSIQSEINRLKTNINNALAAVAAKGVSVPADATSDDLESLILQISTAGGGNQVYVVVQGAANEVITFASALTAMTATTNSQGSVVTALPLPESGQITYTATGSVSNYSKTFNVSTATTDIRVMPDGALYWYGNTCNWFTGGISADGWSYSSTNVSNSGYTKFLPTFNTNTLEFPKQAKGIPIYATVNAINMSAWSSLNLNVVSGTASNDFIAKLGVDTDKSVTSSSATKYLNVTTTGVRTVDVSSVTNNAYPYVLVPNESSAVREMIVDKMWLE